MNKQVEDLESDAEDMDPSVPTELLEIHIALEENDMTPEEFEKEFGS
jgi:hypothetical protein